MTTYRQIERKALSKGYKLIKTSRTGACTWGSNTKCLKDADHVLVDPRRKTVIVKCRDHAVIMGMGGLMSLLLKREHRKIIVTLENFMQS